MSSVSSTGSSSAANALTSSQAAQQVLSGLSASGLAFSGLASGLDTTSIIQTLQQFGQEQVTNLQNQISGITTQETDFKALDADLLSLQSQAESLATTTNGVFDANTATVSNTSVASATAAAGAVPGVYGFTVNNLAQAQEIASQGYAATTSTITQGTYSLQLGNGATTSITVGSTNNTVQQFVDAINNAQSDITASIVNTGGSSTNPSYRILLSSNETGAANTINVGFTGSSDNTQPIFNATYVGSAVAGTSNTSTATVTSNVGAGGYLGAKNNTYTFTVANTGTVGTNAITLNVTDSTGDTLQSITIPSGAGATAAQTVYVAATGGGSPQSTGVQISVGGTGKTLESGDTFTVNAYIPTVQAAQDSSVTLGSGNGSLTVTNSNNLVSGLIPGVTLNLQSAAPSSPVTVTVATDTTSASEAVNGFVNAYNQFINDVATDTAYNADSSSTSSSSSSTPANGPLLGNGDIGSILDQVKTVLNTVVPGLSNQANNLFSIGISVNSDGTLAVNSTTLANVLSGQSGVSLANLKQLFGLTAQSSNSGIQFLSGTNNTQAPANPVQVNITQAATQGSLTGTAFTSPLIPITSGSNTLTVTVDGETSNTLTLTPNATGYTPAQLAQQLQSLVNADPVLGNGAVAVSLNGSNQLQLTSQAYGSYSTVAVSGTALSSLNLTNPTTVAGTDVAGSFTVNGATEDATGSGQILTGNSGNANTDGLALNVTLTAAQVGAGATANLTVTRGLASSMAVTLNSLTDPNTGRFQSIDTGFQNQISDLNTQITNDNQLLQQQQATLTAQFANLETIISSLKEQSQVVSSFANTADNIASAANGSSSSSNSSGSSSSSSGSSL